jgi:hypothetical protein
MAEIALGIWIAAGIAMLLGRFLPVYISGAVVGAVAVGFAFMMIDYWHETVTPYASFDGPELWDVLVFTIIGFLLAAYLFGPVAGLWL